MNANDALPLTQAIINIRNLRLRTFIGFNPEELEKQQDVVINIEIHYPIGASFISDDVSDALNYKVITKKIISHVESGQFKLLERLTSDVLHLCCAAPEVIFARVTIDKPHALRFADSVSLTLEYTR
ncbi:dihydroneopterin triphosphate 2'-epimerase [Shewanella sp. NIFS-20-20]|uniref:dihydroneopterin triphosphate 2'-epimerase n=1 Tax=Shewanella sp. NIFS-20-20 TaxID=2853806 RepID=UPI001C48F32B|nr:dihydroneopterin triphosphate 2'-epimerase [Shewanella sp. NIFS-20-20]MBV7316994.1 dihydroneopterin triphosphate 2'-epimerase [Shewanella sp. NIFS-20-20]